MIFMNHFKADKDLREKMLSAVARVIDSEWYVLGQEVEAFERNWASICGVRFGIGVGNGLHAIEIALRSMDIGPGDEVITTPMTAFATVLAIYRVGAQPVLADIEPDRALLSIESVQRCLSSRTKAILLVHIYGQIADMHSWVDLCKCYKIALVEDCAQAHLASWQGRTAGSFGEVGAYSFYPTKNLGAIGDAGMVVTDNEWFAKKALCLRNYGQSVRGYHSDLGMNSRLDEIQAAILQVRLQWLVEFTNNRRTIAKAYREAICHPLVKILLPPEEQESHVYHLFVITCEAREALQAHLQHHGIQTLIHYPVPVHHQKPCSNIMRDPNGLINSEFHANTCLSLPCHPQMSKDQVEIVIEAINTFPCP
ncbi:MAG: DegT/DnrJ/EryC1/StrS family aminotransferase [Magnetococcales bacterium]|nr:DegT/DnrJ/EryC1/StrS family aminotransferase [Magnetococcales bacterium]